jgi:hypothetical protein
MDMRRRIKQIYSWLQLNYNDEYCMEGGVVALTPEQKNDPSVHHYGNDFDLCYSRFNVTYLKAFIGSIKLKGNGKHCSFVHIRKFRDAIKFGAEEAKQDLPAEFDREMKSFLLSCKKEVTNQKKQGNLDEQESDPISIVLYQMICEWALASNNILVWVWTVLQWNCMARSASIDPLGFHNFSKGVDSILIKYDDSKADNAGEKVSPKNLFANPFNPIICPFTALGCYLCVNRETFSVNDKIFQKRGKDGSAAANYCNQLSALIEKCKDEVNSHSRPDHTNTHGIRKGSAIHATSGSTCPPPLSSVANRGEWSLGKIFEIYFQFAEPGDCFLGRVLAGLDCNSTDFATLPPHFKEQSKDHAAVREAMDLCFGPIIATHDCDHSISAILFFCLASMVHHSGFLLEHIGKNTTHSFVGIPLLNRSNLLNELKGLISFEVDATMRPTGIPPHVRQAQILQDILNTTTATLERLIEQTDEIKRVIREAIIENDIQSGRITLPVLLEKLEEHQQNLTTMLDNKLKSHLGPWQRQSSVQQGNSSSNNGVPGVFNYEGREWDVPQHWLPPRQVKRRVGWDFWLLGQPNFCMQDASGVQYCPIKPFRLFKPTRLPLGVAGKWKTEWKPIFDLMEGYSTFQLDLESLMSLDVDFNTSSILNQSFDSGTDHVKSRAQYIWNFESRRIDTWTIGQWSKMVKYSNIARNGTEGDKRQLSPMRFRNYPRRRQRMNDDEDSDFDRETECHSDGAAGEEDLDREPTEREV